MEAGRLMLKRIHQLLEEKADFAFETTLATRSYQSLIKKAKAEGYQVTLLYFWLSSPELAKRRVASRVKKGGHNIPDEVIDRRYHRGKHNFTQLYTPICDNWISIKTENTVPEKINSNISDELADVVMKGMNIAIRKLIKRSAANNEELTIVDKHGNIKSIPAKDMLPSVN